MVTLKTSVQLTKKTRTEMATTTIVDENGDEVAVQQPVTVFEKWDVQ